jgi:hypothetical protein
LHDRTQTDISSPVQDGSLKGPGTGVILLVAALAVGLFCLIHRGTFPGWLDDLRVYSHAFEDWRAGRDPYGTPFMSMYFLYPPIFLYVQALLSSIFAAPWGQVAYAALHLTAICSLPVVLARYFFRQQWLSPLFAMLVFFAAPRFTGILTLGEMNIATTLYLLAFVGAIPGLRHNRWRWFYLAVFAAAMVKITLLVLLLLPMLAGRWQRVRTVLCGLAVFAAYLLERFVWPELYGRYQWSMAHAIPAQQAYGYGIFGVLSTYHVRQHSYRMVPFLVSVLIALLVVALMLRLRRRLWSTGWMTHELSGNGRWLALVVMSIILVNPRLMQYDADIALLASFVLWVHVLRRYVSSSGRLLLLQVLLFVPSLLVPLVVLNPHMHGTYETMLLWLSFSLGYWQLWREATAEEKGAELLAAVRAGGRIQEQVISST